MGLCGPAGMLLLSVCCAALSKSRPRWLGATVSCCCWLRCCCWLAGALGVTAWAAACWRAVAGADLGQWSRQGGLGPRSSAGAHEAGLLVLQAAWGGAKEGGEGRLRSLAGDKRQGPSTSALCAPNVLPHSTQLHRSASHLSTELHEESCSHLHTMAAICCSRSICCSTSTAGRRALPGVLFSLSSRSSSWLLAPPCSGDEAL